jgi:hypothetical protein
MLRMLALAGTPADAVRAEHLTRAKVSYTIAQQDWCATGRALSA